MSVKRLVVGSIAGTVAGAWAATTIMVNMNAPESQVSVDPPVKHVINEQAILDSLRETPQLVGMTGDVSKSITFKDDKWYGDKSYKLTLNGEFKLGIDTKDIDIKTEGNTVIVKFPHPKVISVNMPFNKAVINEDIGLLRKDLDDSHVQGLYAKAYTSAVNEIKVNVKARDRAEDAIENSLEQLIEEIPYVERVEFE